MMTPHETTLDVNSTAKSMDAADTESLGAWLTRARTRFNAEQRDIAHHLGLNPSIIAALESDDLSQLGPPVFVRGYLTRYARLLGLPEQEALERYQRQMGTSQKPPPLQVTHPLRRQTRVRDLRGVFYLALLVGIAWTAIQNLNNLDPSRLLTFWSDGRSDSVSRTGNQPANTDSRTQYPFQAEPATTTASASLATKEAPLPQSSTVIPASSNVGSPAPAAPMTPASPPQPATVSPTSGVVLTANTPSAAGSPESAAGPAIQGVVAIATVPATGTPMEAGGASSANEAKLLLEFSNDCWMEVKDAQGNVLANGLMKANSAHTISGSAPFKVTLGNAPAARIILDDRLVNTDIYVPRRGTVSRFTLDRGQP